MPNSNPDIPRSRLGAAGTTVHRAKFDSEEDAARASELLANSLFYRLNGAPPSLHLLRVIGSSTVEVRYWCLR